MNQRIDGDEDLEKPVRNPADKIGRDHSKNDPSDLSMRTLFHFRAMLATDRVKTNENEDVERCDHWGWNEKAQEEAVVGKNDFRWNCEENGRKIDHASKGRRREHRWRGSSSESEHLPISASVSKTSSDVQSRHFSSVLTLDTNAQQFTSPQFVLSEYPTRRRTG